MLLKFLLLTLIALVGSISCFPESRVVNGSATDITKYPFMIALRFFDGSFSCGATTIAPRWVLTAAHCVYGLNADALSIQYGTAEISENGENVVNVTGIITHEDYDPYNYYANDIALLELERPLVYNYRTVSPVTLPEPYFEIPQTQEGVPGVLTGWGLNETSGSVQTTLQEVHLKIYSDSECYFRYNEHTTADHICGGVDEGGKGQCTGDSGGPLIYQRSTQLGIVSWSYKPCAAAPFPGVFTKVSHYVDWIHSHID